jgi:hypothetical protein
MDTYIINTLDEFNKYFHIFKDSSKIDSTPNVFVIGFDIEFISRANYPMSFSNMNWLNNNINTGACIIQLSSSSIVMIINLINMNGYLPNKLINVITNDAWIKLGIGIEQDLNILSDNFNLGHCGGGIELKNIILMSKINNPNLERIYNMMIGSHVKKTKSICDWTKPLNDQQLQYAARDAIMSYQLGISILQPSIDNLISIKADKSTDSLLHINFKNNINVDDNNNNDNLKRTDNYIGILNEWAQSRNVSLPLYTMIDYDRSISPTSFTIQCKVSNYIDIGKGSSKKKAKQISAMNVLKQIGITNKN